MGLPPDDGSRPGESASLTQSPPSVDPSALRALAANLLAVAAAIEAADPADTSNLSPTDTPRDHLPLLASAEAEYTARRKRSLYIPSALFGEPCWDMLLDLYIQNARRMPVSVTSACHASDVPMTTAMRWISTLEAHRLIERVPSVHDRRVQYIRLTGAGELAVARCLKHRTPA